MMPGRSFFTEGVVSTVVGLILAALVSVLLVLPLPVPVTVDTLLLELVDDEEEEEVVAVFEDLLLLLFLVVFDGFSEVFLSRRGESMGVSRGEEPLVLPELLLLSLSSGGPREGSEEEEEGAVVGP